MEAPPEINNMSIGVLSRATKWELSLLLNDTSETLVEGRVMDYRGLAELYGKGFQFISELEEKRDPMATLLTSLTGKDALLSILWEKLGHLGRTDVQRRCRDRFCQDVVAWQQRRPRDRAEAEQIKNERKRSQIQAFFKDPAFDQPQALEQRELTSQGGVASASSGSSPVSRSNEMNARCAVKRSTVQKSGSRPVNQKILSTDDDGTTCAMYDAYINCAEEDIVLAKKMLSVLESSPYNLRLFLPQRQLMPGGCQMEDIADVLKDRCRRKVIIILTRNYLDSEACHFVTNFSRALDPGAKQKQIIPILYEDIGETPRMLTGLQFISKQRDEKRGWFWSRLRDAINNNQG
ncbi:myeloid differentiation primary response protein MyD88-like [Haliotis rubra]|uniref:myeloid differentiation primary response protein MyD88-like n=1 Tax=Haliotis rubra TaxID=36100 RepID=UPI001EE504B8|nr:myeloid differentiation primary response protein MyD88-like [Haliotis rubra]